MYIQCMYKIDEMGAAAVCNFFYLIFFLARAAMISRLISQKKMNHYIITELLLGVTHLVYPVAILYLLRKFFVAQGFLSKVIRACNVILLPGIQKHPELP